MSKKVLLIADDVEMNRSVIKRFLSHEYDVLEAETGVETLNILENNKVDALLLDIIMPEMNGLEVLEKIKDDERYKNLAILVATSTKEKTERTSLSLGADDVVSKPYDPIVIEKRLANIVAFKQVQITNCLLDNHEVDKLINQKYDNVKMRLLEMAGTLNQIADVVNGNLDNTKLVHEMADSVRKEADNILDIIKTEF